MSSRDRRKATRVTSSRRTRARSPPPPMARSFARSNPFSRMMQRPLARMVRQHRATQPSRRFARYRALSPVAVVSDAQRACDPRRDALPAAATRRQNQRRSRLRFGLSTPGPRARAGFALAMPDRFPQADTDVTRHRPHEIDHAGGAARERGAICQPAGAVAHDAIHARQLKRGARRAIPRRPSRPSRGKCRSAPFARYSIFISVVET